MVVRPLSKSSRLRPYTWEPPRVAERPRIPRDRYRKGVEELRGEIRGQPASDIEERMYYALVKRYGSEKIDFQPTIIGSRNILGEIRPDFVVDAGITLTIFYADGEYAHKSAAQREEDNMKDEILFHQMQGVAEFPIRISGDDLQTQEDADEAIGRV